MRRHNTVKPPLTCTLLILLSGCAETSTQTTSQTPAAMTSQQAQESFKEIARASCDAALSEGVVERSEAKDGFVLVMVPKANAYQDFSAAYFQPADTYELIWEIDAFSACGASITFDLAEEAGQEPDLEISFNPKADQFETFQDFGEYGQSNLGYKTEDGKITTVINLESEDLDTRTVSYGNLTEADVEILETAVDRFLAKSN